MCTAASGARAWAASTIYHSSQCLQVNTPVAVAVGCPLAQHARCRGPTLCGLLGSPAADYRVPVVLREHGILVYAPPLAAAVDGQQELAAGGREEVEIRGCTIVAVDRMREALSRRLVAEGRAGEAGQLSSVKVDWWLWELGERSRHQHRPHHRTLTVYY